MRWNQFSQHLSNLAGATTILAIALALGNVALAGSKYKVLYSFTGGDDGGGVFASVALNGRGRLYGKTSGGGDYGYGTVFELKPGSGGKWTETVLHSFCAKSHCDDGAASFGGVILDVAGNLFGGSNTATFEMTPGGHGWEFRVIYKGASEVGLVLDKVGNLYGPLGAGKYGDGAISELSLGSNGWSESVLYSFCPPPRGCQDGDTPLAPPTFDAAGNLSGTTEFGGNSPLSARPREDVVSRTN